VKVGYIYALAIACQAGQVNDQFKVYQVDPDGFNMESVTNSEHKFKVATLDETYWKLVQGEPIQGAVTADPVQPTLTPSPEANAYEASNASGTLVKVAPVIDLEGIGSSSELIKRIQFQVSEVLPEVKFKFKDKSGREVEVTAEITELMNPEFLDSLLNVTRLLKPIA
jgi:hypothetical protein